MKKTYSISTLAAFTISLLLQVSPALAHHTADFFVLFRKSEWVQTITPGATEFSGPFEIRRIVDANTDPREVKAKVTVNFYRLIGNCSTSVNDPANLYAFGTLGDKVLNSLILNEGAYVAKWNGMKTDGFEAPSGSACFKFKATDPHNKVIREEIGDFQIAASGTGGDQPSGGTGTGAGNAQQPATSGPSILIYHTVNPVNLNLRTGPSSATIEVIARQNIRTSIAIEIHDEGGRIVNSDLPFSSGLVAGTSLTIFWDGTCGVRTQFACSETPNRKVKTGRYLAKYFIGGNLEAWDAINVNNDPPPPPDQPPVTPPAEKIAEISVVPNEFNPRAGEFATFSFKVLEKINSGVIVKIKNASGETVNSDVFRGPVPLSPRPEAYTAIWSGSCRYASARNACLTDGFVPASNQPYRFEFILEGQRVFDGNITVTGQQTDTGTQPPQSPGAFIVSHQAIPQEFVVGGSTTVVFTTGKAAQNLKVAIKSIDNSLLRKNLTVTAITSSSCISENTAQPCEYAAMWDGALSHIVSGTASTAQIGDYKYEISAANETAVSGGIKIVLQSPPPGTPAPLELTLSDPSRSIFSPALSESIEFRFKINQPARITARIWKGAQVVRTLLQPSGFANNAGSGETSLLWRGETDSGRYLSLPEDNSFYTLIIDAQNDKGDGKSGQKTIEIRNAATTSTTTTTTTTTTSTQPPRVSRLDPLRNPFDPDRENTAIRYILNQEAFVTITIRRASDNVLVRTLIDAQRRSASTTYEEIWSGTDYNSNRLSDNIYRYTIYASNQYGSDSVTGELEIRRIYDISTLALEDLGPSRIVFNPLKEKTVLRYRVNRSGASVTAEILESGAASTRLVLLQSKAVSSSDGWITYEAEWNGYDRFGLLAQNDTYAYRITATLAAQQRERIGFIRAYRESATTTKQQDDGLCAGFKDVSKTDEICPAVKFVVALGIFLGDSGKNTLRPNDHLQRAEAAAVSQRAFGYSLASYSPVTDKDLGFRDLKLLREWYMPYIKTYTIRKVLTGYPDKTMRPTRIMGRAELYKMFTEGALQAPRAITHFIITRKITWKPYIDTPVKRDTKWYLPFADFAKVNDLTVDSRFFRPAKEITRAEVIKLIYDTHLKSLITYERRQNVAAR